MTIPEKSQIQGQDWGHSDGQSWQSLDGQCFPSLAPARPGLGRFTPFLTSFPEVSPWPTFPAFPFASVRVLVRDFKRNNITKASSGAKTVPNASQTHPKPMFLCLPRVVFPSFPITRSPRSQECSGISCLLSSLSLGLQESGTEGNGNPQAGSAQGGFQTSLSLFLPCVPGPAATQAQPRQGLGWTLQKSVDLGKAEQKIIHRKCW